MDATIEVLLSPAEYQARGADGFADSVCIVFDVLRATSVMVTGLANGAAGFVPVAGIPEALAGRGQYPDALLAGERDGLRITATRSGGVKFALGNSPREYTAERVRNRIILCTTTNGTRALRACASARTVGVGSFLNLNATASWLTAIAPKHLTLVCAGTAEFPALEDILCAGALCELLVGGRREDSAELALRAYREAEGDLSGAVASSRNGRRLLAMPELRADVEYCLRRDVCPFAVCLEPDGVVRKVG